MKQFDANAFIRAIYLNAMPSVDLSKLGKDEKVDCCAHKIKMSKVDEVYAEFGLEVGTDLYGSCNMWLVCSGPQLVEG